MSNLNAYSLVRTDDRFAYYRRAFARKGRYATVPLPFAMYQRVRLSAAGREHFRAEPNVVQTGIVVGGSYPYGHLRVRLDGRTSVGAYHRSFWEPAEAAG